MLVPVDSSNVQSGGIKLKTGSLIPVDKKSDRTKFTGKINPLSPTYGQDFEDLTGVPLDRAKRSGPAMREGIRGLVSGKGFVDPYMEGFNNPEGVKSFQDQSIEEANKVMDNQKLVNRMGETGQTVARNLFGIIPSAVGMGADILTDPPQALAIALIEGLAKGIAPTKAGQTIEKALNTDIAIPVKKFAGKTISNIKSVPENIIESGRNLMRSKEQMINPPIPFERRVAGVKSQASKQMELSLEESANRAKKIAQAKIGMSPEEIDHTIATYEGSTAPLVDEAKTLIKSKIQKADKSFESTIENAKNDLRVKTGGFGKTLEKTIRELKSGIGKPNPVVKDLEAMLSDITDNEKVSKVLDASGNQVVLKGQGYKDLDKEQFLGTRRNINDLFTQNGEIDIKIQRLKDLLDQSAIETGVKGLKESKQSYKLAREMEGKFLNKNTGDLKVANETSLSKLGTKSRLDKQTIDHIKELEKYIENPIIERASKINKIREFEKTFNDPNKKIQIPIQDQEIIKKRFNGRLERVQQREDLRNRLLARKKGRQKLAKFSGGAAILAGAPEATRRIIDIANK